MRNGIVAVGAVLLLSAWIAIAALAPLDPVLLGHLWFLPGIGLIGATIANTSGTGGGVVFVPVFNLLRARNVMQLSPGQVVAASFAIQCFGMTMGALRWSAWVHAQPAEERKTHPGDFWSVVTVVLAASLPVMLATQRLARFDPHDVLLAFKGFSVLLGLAVIATTWTVNRERPARTQLSHADLAILAAIGLAGGFITALFSVGVGELVALYCFIRHYPVALSAGSAVVVSSISCLAGVAFHILQGHVVWNVVVLAAPGAMLGGFCARPLATWLGAKRLKTIDGCWIVGSSLYLIALNV